MIAITPLLPGETIEALFPNSDTRVALGRFARAMPLADDVALPANRFFVFRVGDDVIGIGAFFAIDWIARSAELTLCASRDAASALRALTQYGLQTLQLHRVAIWFSSRDARAIALAKRAGYEDDGRLRDYFYAGDGHSDLLIKSHIAHE